jgi:hypothetical protein
MALSSPGTSVKIRAMPIRHLLVVLSLAGLASCGGGGDGGSGGSHTGFPTTQANLTAANAPTFARYADLAARAAATMRLGETMTLVSPNNFTQSPCAVAGAGPANVALTASTGPVSGTATYTSFDRCLGMRVSGTASVTGTMQAGGIVDNMSFPSSTLTFSTATETIQTSGTAALDWTSVPPDSTYLMTLNATASGAASFRLDNFQINSQIVAGSENVAISGRLTTSEGFVDIATGGTRPQLFVPSTGLQGGPITMTGTTTIATVTYNPGGPPTISIAPR